MTVAELISYLQQCDPTLTVVVPNNLEGIGAFDNVEEVKYTELSDHMNPDADDEVCVAICGPEYDELDDELPGE